MKGGRQACWVGCSASSRGHTRTRSHGDEKAKERKTSEDGTGHLTVPAGMLTRSLRPPFLPSASSAFFFHGFSHYNFSSLDVRPVGQLPKL
jgi:hypothetical protein